MQHSLPVPGSTLSHWHQTTRSWPHLNANQDSPVPSSTRYLIVGAGISGALTAWELVNHGVDGKDILIVEAREAVSGATGRNAGHIRPDAFRGFLGLAAAHGSEQARKVLEDEKAVLAKAKEFVESNNIDCNFRYTTTLEVCLESEYAVELAESLEAFRAAGGDTSHVRLHEGSAAQDKSRMSHAVCAYEWPAASNHPVKLTQWILEDAIGRGVKLWTHCPAVDIQRHEGQASGLKRWDVHTPRGVVSADTIVHCTNAYAAHLLPGLVQLIRPRRAQGHSYVPPASLAGDKVLQSTMSLRYGAKHYFSVNQLTDGTMIFGGQATRDDKDRDMPEYTQSRFTFDDATHNPYMMKNSVKEFSTLANGGLENECNVAETKSPMRPGEGLTHVWTGLVAETPDHLPYIGPIEGLDGQWIAAGYNGHGMARVFTCIPGLVKLIMGSTWSETGLPECYAFGADRMRRLAEVNVQS
ncbi:FAD dependent oxidoreductase [Microdochium trichocladiopsis]|uniref:FAD dependent oxidoreductase n=1 Tax=Microdochium trichocladiopsis TaxID=1682393 RepID=A0A9P8XV80_9PEZI|nr:FAD dependent oxidoreductase [Microdochium trichocladiopsis]KAH7014412.1 FAD dependent oxidoreductase [Microdochium trichocladiopsis]